VRKNRENAWRDLLEELLAVRIPPNLPQELSQPSHPTFRFTGETIWHN
jgi:hypothetical protein